MHSIILYMHLMMYAKRLMFNKRHKFTTNHEEEADTRLFLHVKDLALQGFQKIAVRTAGIYVLVLAASLYQDIQDKVNKLWVDFGVGKDRCFFPSP